MPIEFIACLTVANFSLYNTNLMGSSEIVAIVPFTLYVGTPLGYKISQKIMVWLSTRAAENPDGWKQLARQIEERRGQ